MSMIGRPQRSIAAATLVALALAGCGSSRRGSSRHVPTRGTPGPSTVAARPDGTVAPGAKVKVGAAALLEYSASGQKGVLKVTVTRIEKGRHADLSVLSDQDATTRKATPYYIHATVQNAGTTDLSHAYIEAMGGLLAGGDQARQLLVMGTFSRCDDYPKTKHFPPGARYQTCSPVLADPGTTVTGALWSSPPYRGLDPTGEVSWTP
jgi:hypothetical protein